MTAASGRIRALAALTTHSVEEARRRHDLYPTAAAALGRTMTGTALMAAGLKGQEKLMVEIVGNGPLGRIVAEANAAVDVADVQSSRSLSAQCFREAGRRPGGGPRQFLRHERPGPERAVPWHGAPSPARSPRTSPTISTSRNRRRRLASSAYWSIRTTASGRREVF